MEERTFKAESLQEQEHILHGRLVEQTRQLQIVRDQLAAYESAIEVTMGQLQEVRQQLYLLWQHAR